MVGPRRSVSERRIENGSVHSASNRVYSVGHDGASGVYAVAELEDEYDSIFTDTLLISPDSRRLAYVARVGRRNVVVLDGDEQSLGEADYLVGSLEFSPDGRRLAYLASADGRQVVVVDGEMQELEEVDGVIGSLTFSPDGRCLAYLAAASGQQVAVVDGTMEERYDDIQEGSLVFSPDSRRLAYVARVDNRQVVVVDGGVKELGEGDDVIGSLKFSPDGRRLAYLAASDGRHVVVVDGKMQKQHDEIQDRSLVFSADGQRLAYIAHETHSWGGEIDYVVVDGRKMKQGSHGYIKSLKFSPNGQKLAYIDWGSLFVDGQKVQGYDGVESVVFTPDNRLAYVVRVTERRRGLLWNKKVGESFMAVVDGQAGVQYDEIVAPPSGAHIVFDSPEQLHYIARKDGEFYLVEERFERL
jgi:dipeptidyl aminopeptidase/acylaminoacyl peptidase